MAARIQPRDLPVEEARAELKRHFSSFAGEGYAEGWAELWNKGDFLPWDRLKPSPALADTLVSHHDVIGTAMVDGRRKKALVPGCGRGVDVLLLEGFGYDVVGLEYSEAAVKACQELAAEAGDQYPVHDEKIGRGNKNYVRGDFYATDWLKDAGMERDAKFDLIYDYTFFCAMNPSMRPAWAKRMSELLGPSPHANLICLEFPTEKPSQAGGPPFASPPKAYMEHLSHPGEKVPYDAEGNVRINPLAETSADGLERVGHWHPGDTHKVGKDDSGGVKDYIAIWRHR